MATENLTVTIRVKVKGMWRLTLLGWALRWWRFRNVLVNVRVDK